MNENFLNLTSYEISSFLTFQQLLYIESNRIAYVFAALCFYAIFAFLSPQPSCRCDTELSEKTVVVTGGTDGVGKETVIELAKRGAEIIMPCRNMAKGRAVAEEVFFKTGNKNVSIFYADFERLQSVQDCAEKICLKASKIDILINNAGIGNGIGITQDGFPRVFGVNHLGPYLLTTRLLELLRKSSAPRIIFVSSVAHLWGKINFDTLNQPDGSWVPAQFRAYAQSKLANVLLAREIHKREENIKTYVAHPGWTFTGIFRDFPLLLKLLVFPLFYLFLYHPKVGAQTQIHLALAKNLQKDSGKYFVSCKPRKTCSAALDCQLAKDLWNYSERTVTSALTTAKDSCSPI